METDAHAPSFLGVGAENVDLVVLTGGFLDYL